MKHLIIGAAGHVDHGKTALVKALTGTDTDRLKEEKKRGITIENGFARLRFDDGSGAAVIDVPGHERFIKNMLAGAGGIDYAMLAVAADEGFMPQTAEHLGILTLLGIGKGMVVITKKDLVDAEWLEMIKEDVNRRTAGTFLENAPVRAVSAFTGEGIPELKELLRRELAELNGRPASGPFRLPVDRVFSMEGFGTVVTGTLIQGTVAVNQEIMVYPQERLCRVRGLQVHGGDTEQAFAGQRVAVNLTGIKKSELERGQVLAAADRMEPSLMLDAELRLLPDTERRILNGNRLHLYHGSRVLLCKAVLLDRDELLPGESCFAQLRLREPLAARRLDPFVVRFYSPAETIGGGLILEPVPMKHKTGDQSVLKALAVKKTGGPRERLLLYYNENIPDFPDEKTALRRLDFTPEEYRSLRDELTAGGELLSLSENRLIPAEALKAVAGKLEKALTAFHRRFPLEAGMTKEEARQKLGLTADKAVTDRLFQLLADRKLVRLEGGCLAAKDFAAAYNSRQTRLREELALLFRQKGLETPSPAELGEVYGKEKENLNHVLEAMVKQGTLLRLNPQYLLDREVYGALTGQALRLFQEKKQVTLGDFRDAAKTSRKYALMILEYWDMRKITRKEGDSRSLVRGFEDL